MSIEFNHIGPLTNDAEDSDGELITNIAGFGIDAQGNPYFNDYPDEVPASERAVLKIDGTGTPIIEHAR